MVSCYLKQGSTYVYFGKDAGNTNGNRIVSELVQSNGGVLITPMPLQASSGTNIIDLGGVITRIKLQVEMRGSNPWTDAAKIIDSFLTGEQIATTYYSEGSKEWTNCVVEDANFNLAGTAPMVIRGNISLAIGVLM